MNSNPAAMPQVGMYVIKGCLIVSVQIELYDDVIRQIEQNILDRIRQSRIRGVILDVSMLEVIDAHIAESIVECANTVDVLGARCIVVGIRPAVASAMMDLESPPLSLRTAVTLEQAMSELEPFVASFELISTESDESPNDDLEDNTTIGEDSDDEPGDTSDASSERLLFAQGSNGDGKQ